MTSRIFLLDEKRNLTPMEETSYESESLLQRLLADHPDLLSGDDTGASEPRRWLLVSREMSMPAEQDGAGRWSLDHLFLDQDGVPTLIEVKRSSDTRIRREVVGQMLDYARLCSQRGCLLARREATRRLRSNRLWLRG